ncbi:hypothetical protein [Demequina litorisediminis]|uniref:Secreted protein n=1 Tax=Demequina litorisediminis TaxID=1849022 RepID=A0ABQ6IME2_9MICO|nr:hypothetical protein [Demequina litorisediminis]GMA37927.1 hypothetical protein GCM10025876_41310 [Demequina litorisediminis]
MAEGGRGGLAAAGVVAVFVAPIFLVLGLAVIGELGCRRGQRVRRATFPFTVDVVDGCGRRDVHHVAGVAQRMGAPDHPDSARHIVV